MSSINYSLKWEIEHSADVGFIRFHCGDGYYFFDMVIKSDNPHRLGIYIGACIYKNRVTEIAACFYAPFIAPIRVFVKPLTLEPDAKEVEKFMKEHIYLPVIRNAIVEPYKKYLEEVIYEKNL